MNRDEISQAIGRAMASGRIPNKQRQSSVEHFQESVDKLQKAVELAVRKKQLLEEVLRLIENNPTCQKMLELLDEASSIDTD